MTDEVLENLKMWSADPLCAAAAKRIEEDGDQIRRLQAYQNDTSKAWTKLTDSQEMEIERMRSALNEIAGLGDVRCDEAPTIARRALGVSVAG